MLEVQRKVQPTVNGVLTIKIEADCCIALAQRVFGGNLIFAGIFYSHIKNLQRGRVQIAVIFICRTL